MKKEFISFDDFQKVDIRIGTITKAEKFEKAINHSYKIWVDFGELGTKKTSAQITKNYLASELVGEQIVGIVNFPKKQIADFNSEFLLLGAINKESDDVILIQPSSIVDDGSKVS
tara:strand:+ start:765 stop:1109 length:345 start_codon:yes stop_codon:yes gene_type:complete